jgi:CheY-like chemotaxis protein
MGFLIKKRTSNKIEDIPVFVLGDFSPQELMAFKRENVKAFISLPVNPTVLKERINSFFKVEVPPLKKTTPMLLDMHARGRIIIIQIEGNLEEEKLEFFNYLLRSYCKRKNITAPKIFIIIPSLYPEGITNENIGRMFRFTEYKELNIDAKNIKLLCQNEKFIAFIKNHLTYFKYQIVKDYIEGMQALLIDFDREKTIPVNFLKAGTSYIFDLYNKIGKVVIPALKNVTQETLEKIKADGDQTLAYFSEINITDLETQDGELPTLFSEDSEQLNLISGEYDTVEQKFNFVEIIDEKLSLFFRNVQEHDVLVITSKEDVAELVKDAFEVYFKIHVITDGKNLSQTLQATNFILIFLDSDLENPTAIDLLAQIRLNATRRKTSVVMLASKIDKVSVIRYRDAGTDNIVLAPFSTKKLLIKVFESMSSDRRT